MGFLKTRMCHGCVLRAYEKVLGHQPFFLPRSLYFKGGGGGGARAFGKIFNGCIIFFFGIDSIFFCLKFYLGGGGGGRSKAIWKKFTC